MGEEVAMLKKALLLLIFSSLFSQSAPVRPDDSPKPYEDGEAYAVYAAVLPSEWPWKVAHAKTLVIRSETKNYGMCLQPEKGFTQSLGAAISDYVELNKRPWLLQSRFDIEKPYLLITPEEFKSAFAQGNWEAFYRQYPDSGGYIELSAVGFNSDKTVAVVYMGHDCGMRCGGGEFHVLQKKDGKWVPLAWKGMSCSWVS
jgi:hypothetical protein